MMNCPIRDKHAPDVADLPRECWRNSCAWWNERFERCSVHVIGDRIDDIAIAMEKEVKTDG
jgi:hypothetical protein